jgi:protein-arginine kinase
LDWPELAALPLPWGGNPQVSPDSPPFVVATRLVSYRNFAGFPFAVSAPPNICAAIADKALNLLSKREAKHPAKRGGQAIRRLADCPPYAIRMLRERHLLPERSVPFPGKKETKYLIIGSDSATWSLVNEVEHLTAGQVFPGRLSQQDFAERYEPPDDEGPSPAGGAAPWAWSRNLGFLTSDPGRIGPGLEAEMIVHLPGLALARMLQQARNSMYASGVELAPATSPGVNSVEAGLFLLKSRGGSGKTVEGVYADFLGSVQPLLDWEAELQHRCVEKHHKRLEERVNASLHRLENAAALAYPELLAAGSNVRLGAYLGILHPRFAGILEELRVTAGSGHLGVSSGRILSKEEEDFQRANVVRLTLEGRHV